FNWFGQPSNYTIGILAVGGASTLRFIQITAGVQGGRRPFMRNLECDFSPHPLLDVHPFWPALIATINASHLGVDPYAANPWYMNDPGPLPQSDVRKHLTDSPPLYHNRLMAGHSSADRQLPQPFR